MNKLILIILVLGSEINCMGRLRRLVRPVYRSANSLLNRNALLHAAAVSHTNKSSIYKKNCFEKRCFSTESSSDTISQFEAYALFNLKPYNTISEKQLRRLFFAQSKYFHPDKNINSLKEYAHLEFIKREKAYRVILDHQTLLGDGTQTNLQEKDMQEIEKIYAKDYQTWKNFIEYQKFKLEQEEKEKKEKEEQEQRQKKQKEEKKKFIIGSALFGTGAVALHLIDQKIKENELNSYFELIKSGNIQEVKKLFENENFDPNIKDPKYKVTGFTWAATLGYTEIVNLFLKDKRFIEFNEVDLEGNSALANAIKFSQKDVIQLLVDDERIEINNVNQLGQHVFDLFNPTHVNNTDIFEILLKVLDKRASRFANISKLDIKQELEWQELFKKNIKEIMGRWWRWKKDLEIFYYENKDLFKSLIVKYNYANSEILDFAIHVKDYELILLILKFNNLEKVKTIGEINTTFMLRLLSRCGITCASDASKCFLEEFFIERMPLELLDELINLRYSFDGNTVWHYLVMYSNKFSTNDLHQTIEKCSKIALKDISKANGNGKTPKQIAIEANNTALINIFEILERKQNENN